MVTNGRSMGRLKKENSIYSIVTAFHGFATEIPGIDREQLISGALGSSICQRARL